DVRLVLTFPVELPANTTPQEVEQWLSASGYTRVQAERTVQREVKADAPAKGKKAKPVIEAVKLLDVVADRFRLSSAEPARVMEAIGGGLECGGRRLTVDARKEGAVPGRAAGSVGAYDLWKFSTGLHCPESDIRYTEPTPSMFSFNSPVGACESCRGFG